MPPHHRSNPGSMEGGLWAAMVEPLYNSVPLLLHPHATSPPIRPWIYGRWPVGCNGGASPATSALFLHRNRVAQNIASQFDYPSPHVSKTLANLPCYPRVPTLSLSLCLDQILYAFFSAFRDGLSLAGAHSTELAHCMNDSCDSLSMRDQY